MRFHKNLIGVALAASFFVSAGAVQASALTSAQIQAIVSLVQSFGADSSTVASVSAALGGGAVPAASCLTLTHNLAQGATGSDVSELQSYLIAKGYLSSSYGTGYFGARTAQAVGQLQLKLGLVPSANNSAYGLMGPLTRSAIGCTDTARDAAQGTTTGSGTLTATASTTSAQAPMLTGISPASGTANTVVTLSGSNLSNASQLRIYRTNGQPVGTIPLISSGTVSSITITISGDMVSAAGPGTYTVRVVTPDGTSNALNFVLRLPQ